MRRRGEQPRNPETQKPSNPQTQEDRNPRNAGTQKPETRDQTPRSTQHPARVRVHFDRRQKNDGRAKKRKDKRQKRHKTLRKNSKRRKRTNAKKKPNNNENSFGPGHQVFIEHLIVGMSHRITMPTLLEKRSAISGGRVLRMWNSWKEVQENRTVGGSGRFAGGAVSHWKTRRNRRGYEQDEALPPMRVDDLLRTARCQKVTPGLGTDVLRPKISL